MGNASVGAVILVGAIISILLGVYLWKKGDPKEPFWLALLDVIGDLFIFHLPVFFTYRAWAVFLWLIGFGILLVAIVALVVKVTA